MSENNENTRPLALVLGAAGGIGSHVAQMLLKRGWRIRALSRRDMPSGDNGDYQFVSGDAMNAADVLAAAQGASLIVHAVNPSGYRDWDLYVLPMLDNTIRAAEAVGARILLPGTLYNFGPDAFPVLTEESPQNPVTSKGAIRVEMEKRLETASKRGVPVLIVRAGDFFGAGAKNNWFSQSLVKPGKKVRSIAYPGKKGVGHQWAYLPDVAETMGRLLDRAGNLEPFAVYQMEGFWDADGRKMTATIGKVTGRNVRIKAFPWWVIRLLSPFVRLFREVVEMRYLWNTPVRMGNKKLVDFLGEEPKTPIEDAVRTTLSDLGCLKGTKARIAALETANRDKPLVVMDRHRL
jgi:nucleoside-diphosphate-sugar epimerase